MSVTAEITLEVTRTTYPTHTREGYTATADDSQGRVTDNLSAWENGYTFIQTEEGGSTPGIRAFYTTLGGLVPAEVVLEVSSTLENAGWTSIVCGTDSLILNREDAAFSQVDGFTQWKWTFPDLSTPGGFIPPGEGLFREDPNTFVQDASIIFKFVNEKIKTRDPVLVEKLSTDTDTSTTYYESGDTEWVHTYTQVTVAGIAITDQFNNTITVKWKGDTVAEAAWTGNHWSESPNSLTGDDNVVYSRKALQSYSAGEEITDEHWSVTQYDTYEDFNAQIFEYRAPTVLEGEAVPLNFNIRTDINLDNNSARGNPETAPYLGFTPLGPTIIDKTNCDVYFSVEQAVDTGVAGSTKYLKVNDFIHGDVAPTAETVEAWKSKLEGQKIRSLDGTFKATIDTATWGALSDTAFSDEPALALDLDLSGKVDALTDGLILLRYLFGLTGSQLTEGVVAPEGLRTEAVEIDNYIQALATALDTYGDGTHILDFDGNNVLDALTDGLMFIRHSFGLTGGALTGGAIAPESDFTDAEVEARLNAAMDATVFLDSFNRIYDSAITPEDAGKAYLTYTVDSDSVRDFPVLHSSGGDLYLEFKQDTNLHHISDPAGGSSSFDLEWEAGTNRVQKISTSSPIALIVPTGEGAYAANLDITTRVIPDESTPFKTNFLIQGVSGPTQTITHDVNNETPEVVSISPLGEIVKWEIVSLPDTLLTGELGTYLGPVILTENCFVEIIRDDLQSNAGKLVMLISPGTGGERFQASVKVPYESGEKTYICKGTVRGSAVTQTVPFLTPLSAASHTETLQYADLLEGLDGVKLKFDLRTAFAGNESITAVEEAEQLRGQLCSVEAVSESGGTLVNRTGPIKATNSSQSTDPVYDLFHDSSLFVPDGTSASWSVTAKLTVKYPDSFTYNSVDYTIVLSGTWKPEFGLEVINPRGGTRLNTVSSPLRYVKSESGVKELNYTTPSQVSNTTAGGYRWHAYSNQTQGGWLITITVKDSADNTVAFKQELGNGPVTIEGIEYYGTEGYYFTRLPNDPTSSDTETTVNGQTIVLSANYAVLVGIPLNIINPEYDPPTYLEVEGGDETLNEEEYVVINNEPESQIELGQPDVSSGDLKWEIKPGNWSFNSEGGLHTYLNQKFALQVLKIQ